MRDAARKERLEAPPDGGRVVVEQAFDVEATDLGVTEDADQIVGVGDRRLEWTQPRMQIRAGTDDECAPRTHVSRAASRSGYGGRRSPSRRAR